MTKYRLVLAPAGASAHVTSTHAIADDGGTVTTPAGWYPDPSGVPGHRYFDGHQWTQHHQPPPGKGPKTKPIVWVVVAVLVLGAVGLGLAMERFKETGEVFPGTTVGMNESASDGKFTFRVTKVSKAFGAVGFSEPRGQWVIVTVDVVNTGREEQSFMVSNQKLIGSNGAEYEADWVAGAAINDENALSLSLGPGFATTMKLPFDLPRGVSPDRIELHDSAFSGGVTVSLE
ncbi:MAG: DUF4352 domain-containing protein [Mycobacterium sp.]